MLKTIVAVLAMGLGSQAFSPTPRPFFVRSTRRATRLAATTSDPAFFRRPVKQVDAKEKAFDGEAPLGEFNVTGQGAVGFKFIPAQDTLKFTFQSAGGSRGHGLEFVVDKNGCSCYDVDPSGAASLVYQKEDDSILDVGRNQTFWMSFDKEHYIIRFGTGYLLRALELFNVTFSDTEDKEKDYLTKYGNLKYYTMDDPGSVAEDGKIKLITSKYPVYEDLPALVKDHDALTLEDLDNNDAVSILELSPECQRLYASVAGMSIELNDDDVPDFSAAIDHSIKTDGAMCNVTLTKKAKSEFESGESTSYDAHQTYLRVTLGSNQGDSPGIPYVMEIWPPACYSPIHNHAQCNAIIKVLHGSLTSRFYAGLNPDDEVPYDQAVVAAGDVTWLDDRQFQTHQLFNHNVGGSACVTIQCYLYNDSDNKHYENFDYIGGDGKIYPFVPNSDWDYGTFKELLRAEWEAYLKTATPEPMWIPVD